MSKQAFKEVRENHQAPQQKLQEVIDDLLLYPAVLKLRKKYDPKLTYSFPQKMEQLIKDPKYLKIPFLPFTAHQKLHVERALTHYKQVIKFDFVEIPQSKAEKKEDHVSFFNAAIPKYAGYCYSFVYDKEGKMIEDYDSELQYKDSDQFSLILTNILVNYKHKDINIHQEINQKGYMFPLLVHEICHVFSMRHGHLNGYTHQHTISSYAPLPGYEKEYENDFAPQTLQLYDVLFLQSHFKPNKLTRSGNTYYHWDKNRLGDIRCIWDGGSTDQINISDSQFSCLVDLRDGQFSSIGSHPSGGNSKSNFSIAYTVNIENLTGSDKGDVIFLNSANNIVNGGNGPNIVYVSDQQLTTDINHKKPKGKVIQRVRKLGWGNDIYYSQGQQNRVVFDIEDPRNISFVKKNNQLQIRYTSPHSNKLSKFTVINYNPEHTLIYFRVKNIHRYNHFSKKHKKAYDQGLALEKKWSKLTPLGKHKDFMKRVNSVDKEILHYSGSINYHVPTYGWDPLVF